MNKSFFILLLLLIFANSTKAQQHVIDSLEKVFSISTEKKTKAKLAYTLAARHVYVNQSKAIDYGYKALQFTSPEDYNSLGKIYNILAIINGEQYNWDKALLLLDSVQFFFEKAANQEAVAQVYSNKGVIHSKKGEYAKALKQFQKSLDIYSESNNTKRYARVLNAMNDVYFFLEDYDKALENTIQVIDIQITNNSLTELASTQNYLGLIYTKKELWNKAILAFDKAIPVFLEHQHHQGLALAYMNKAFCLQKQKHIDLAFEAMEKASQLKNYFESKTTLLDLYLSQASLYFDANKYAKSIHFYHLALDSNKVLDDETTKKLAFEGLVQNYIKTNDFKNAYFYNLEGRNIQDSLVAKNNKKIIRELDIKYETQKTAHQNVLLAKERDFQLAESNKNKKLFYLSLSVLLLVLILSFLLLKQYRANATHMTNKLNYQLLRNQMNPHFLFNSLGAIQSFIYENKPLEAGDYLASFATLMRAILDNSSQENITLKKELDWLENYLSLQLLRFDNSFEYSIHLDPKLNTTDVQIPPMLIQPFIENALEHGLKKIDYKGKIDIHIHLINDMIQINIVDNGMGFVINQSTPNPKHISHALRITKERIAFLNKKQSKNIFFDIKSNLKKGTEVSFSIPLH